MDLLENKEINDDVSRHPWELGRFEIISQNVAGVYKNIPKGYRKVLVDIGCGDAYVLRKLTAKFEFERYVGVDINFTPENQENLKKVNNKIDYLTHISQLELDQNDYVVILMNDVLEHIDEHEAFLAELKLKLDKVSHSSVFITVPAYQFLFSQHDIDLGHYRRYKVQDLEAYSSILNMKSGKKGYFFLSLFLIRWIQKMVSGSVQVNTGLVNSGASEVVSSIDSSLGNSESSSGNTVDHHESIGVADWNGSAFATKALTWVLRADYVFLRMMSILGLRLPGLSAYILYSK